LESATPTRRLFERKENTTENEVRIALVVRLGAIESLVVETVKRLCAPLFAVFDFATFSDGVYQQIVTDVLNGKVS
jgi:hypothetical protein